MFPSGLCFLQRLSSSSGTSMFIILPKCCILHACPSCHRPSPSFPRHQMKNLKFLSISCILFYIQDFAFINHMSSPCWQKNKTPSWIWVVRAEDFAQVSDGPWSSHPVVWLRVSSTSHTLSAWLVAFDKAHSMPCLPCATFTPG